MYDQDLGNFEAKLFLTQTKKNWTQEYFILSEDCNADICHFRDQFVFI